MTEHVYYQWLPGTENDGVVSILKEIYVDDGDVYYKFTDGTECFEGLIADYTNDPKKIKGFAMVRILNPNNIWSFETIKNKALSEFAGVSSETGSVNFEIPSLGDYKKNGEFQTDEGKINFIPPKKQVKFLSKIDYKDWMNKDDQIKFGLISEDENQEIFIIEDNKDDILPVIKMEQVSNVTELTDNNDIITINKDDIIDNAPLLIEKDYKTDTCLNVINISNNKLFDDNDPVAILVNKSAKFESTISMDLKLELPSKSLFDIATENFENGEETFINVILSHIDYNVIRDTLKNALLDAYKIK